MSGDGVHYFLLADLAADEFPHLGAVAQHDYSLAIAHDLFQLGTDEQDRHPFGAKRVNQFFDFRLRTHIDTPRWFIQY